MHLEHEAKFIDDLKRAILLDGGYVKSLDQEVNIWAVFVLWREGAPESKSREGEAGRQGERCMLCSSEAFYVQFRQNLAQTVHSIEHAIVCGMVMFVAHYSMPNHQYLTIQFTLLNPVQLRSCSLFF